MLMFIAFAQGAQLCKRFLKCFSTNVQEAAYKIYVFAGVCCCLYRRLWSAHMREIMIGFVKSICSKELTLLHFQAYGKCEMVWPIYIAFLKKVTWDQGAGTLA